MHAEPKDYDLLMEQLSQVVKPHISQLIDLASDKRETTTLIMVWLTPELPTIYPPNNIDIPALISHVTSEVQCIVAPLDTHKMKEQVSDLVVKTLDSRMDMRDRVLDGLSNKLAGGMDRILESMDDITSRGVKEPGGSIITNM